jgi:hypothetical protein
MINEEPQPTVDPEPLLLESDRRAAERYPCNLQPFWRIVGEDQGDTHLASVRNVSTTGIGLCARQPLKAGTVLIITLRTPRHHLSRPLPVRVMHSTLQAAGDWLIGCQFVRRLSDQDLQALLREE